MNVLPVTALGPDNAPAVLFLHGFMGQRSDWDEVMHTLAGPFRCVAVDLPGHGEAVGLPDEAYTTDGMTARVLATLDDLGIERASVVGYSMGGRLALGLALHYPARCTRLILESASPGLRSEAERAERLRLDAERAAEIGRDFDGFLDCWYRLPLFGLEDRPELRASLVERRRGNDPAELARSLRGFGTGQQASLWEALDGLAMPALAVAGWRDPKYTDLAFALSAAAPPLTPIVTNAGHLVHLEHPGLFAALVGDFLRLPVARTDALAV